MSEWSALKFSKYFKAGVKREKLLSVLTDFILFTCNRRANFRLEPTTAKRWAKLILSNDSQWGKQAGPKRLVDRFLAHFDEDILAYLDNADRPSYRTDVDRTYFINNSIKSISDALSLHEIRSRAPFETAITTFKCQITSKKYLYLRKSISDQISIGLFEIFVGGLHRSPYSFFTLLNSSSVPGSTERHIYAYAGDILESDDIRIAIATLSSPRIENVEQIRPLMIGGRSDSDMIFSPIQSIRTFNMKLVGTCLSGVAFIKDGDSRNAVSPFLIIPIDSNRKRDALIFDELRQMFDSNQAWEKVKRSIVPISESNVSKHFKFFMKQPRTVIDFD